MITDETLLTSKQVCPLEGKFTGTLESNGSEFDLRKKKKKTLFIQSMLLNKINTLRVHTFHWNRCRKQDGQPKKNILLRLKYVVTIKL